MIRALLLGCVFWASLGACSKGKRGPDCATTRLELEKMLRDHLLTPESVSPELAAEVAKRWDESKPSDEQEVERLFLTALRSSDPNDLRWQKIMATREARQKCR